MSVHVSLSHGASARMEWNMQERTHHDWPVPLRLSRDGDTVKDDMVYLREGRWEESLASRKIMQERFKLKIEVWCLATY